MAILGVVEPVRHPPGAVSRSYHFLNGRWFLRTLPTVLQVVWAAGIVWGRGVVWVVGEARGVRFVRFPALTHRACAAVSAI